MKGGGIENMTKKGYENMDKKRGEMGSRVPGGKKKAGLSQNSAPSQTSEIGWVLTKKKGLGSGLPEGLGKGQHTARRNIIGRLSRAL